ncbi:MAG: hypothetical protein RQ758_04065 [Methanomicrobiaceae archaeon]|nr:hypothetical protein [Methanomicrobiaceae archaeon]
MAQLLESNMHADIRAMLRRWYPPRRGWKIFDRDEEAGGRPDFLVERTDGDIIERTVCEVVAARKIMPEHIARLNHYAESLSGEKITILEKILAVPAGTDTSVVPPDISVLVLWAHPVE